MAGRVTGLEHSRLEGGLLASELCARAARVSSAVQAHAESLAEPWHSKKEGEWIVKRLKVG